MAEVRSHDSPRFVTSFEFDGGNGLILCDCMKSLSRYEKKIKTRWDVEREVLKGTHDVLCIMLEAFYCSGQTPGSVI